MIRWAFLDVGNVLLDEDPLTFRAFRVHVEAVRAVRPDLSFERLLADREERALSGSRWPLYEVVSRHLGDDGCTEAWKAAEREVRAHYDDLSPPIAGAEEMLDALARRFRLGLIANQGPECRRRLARLGWLNRFEVVALSEEEGLFKPDPALFRLALERAGVEPPEALMVGDRLDNDIAPASAMGMSTIWVRWPSRRAKGWSPSEPEESAYLDSLERIASRPIEPIASRAVDDLGGVISALLGRASADSPRSGENLNRPR
jgi:HAD superfamily hydrolase (TIGR01549 family)